MHVEVREADGMLFRVAYRHKGGPVVAVTRLANSGGISRVRPMHIGFAKRRLSGSRLVQEPT